MMDLTDDVAEYRALAMSLGNLSILLADLGRDDEAEQAHEEMGRIEQLLD
jgi:hypothetical protein